jgi:hypothetical protein
MAPLGGCFDIFSGLLLPLSQGVLACSTVFISSSHYDTCAIYGEEPLMASTLTSSCCRVSQMHLLYKVNVGGG